MRSLSRPVLVLVAVFAMSACGDDDDVASDPPDTVIEDATTPPEDDADDANDSGDTSDTSDTSDTGSDEPEDPGETVVADACSLLDADFLNDTFEGQTGTFGDPYDFREPLQESPSEFCSWKDTATTLTLQITVEDAATAETDDHSGRTYNIDEEPTVEPQDGPGTKAVLLVDTAFVESGGDGFPYGFFFVEGDVAVFVETVGLKIGAEGLRTLADEADARLLAG